MFLSDDFAIYFKIHKVLMPYIKGSSLLKTTQRDTKAGVEGKEN
jgi:hypothetical protein